MTQFVVPRPYQAGLTKLVTFDGELRQKLLDALVNEEPTVNLNRLIERVASKLAEARPDEIDDALRSIVGLYLRRANYDGTLSDMIEGIVQSPALNIAEGEREHFREYFSSLLNIEALDVTVKALNMAVDNERVFYTARVLTDIRPIFVGDLADSAVESPYAAVIIHTLKLSYYQEGEGKDIYVTLDSEDIGTLRTVLQRADAKAESLKSMLAPTHVRYLDPEEK